MNRRCISLWLLAAALAWPAQASAQEQGVSPALRFGISAGLVASDNRGLDATSAGSTFEYTTRLDFGATFATPVQQLIITGDVALRDVTGAESGSLDTGLVEPNLSIAYARQSRNAQLSATLRTNEVDISSDTLEDVIGVPDPVLVTEDGTRRSTVFDTELELRRQSPFGITLSTGFTALRFTDSITETDQDRFRLGTLLRFDLTPVTQATLNLRYSTFEDFGTLEGVRETLDLTGRLRQTLRTGDVSLQFGATDTEEGSRFSLSAGRSVSTALWNVGGTLGITRGNAGNLTPNASLDVTRTLPDGSLGATFSRSVSSGVDDEEQDITTLSVTYAKQLNTLTRFNTSLTFSETDDTAAADASSFGTLGVNLQRSLTADLQLNVGLQHRISNTAGTQARDNRLSITLRRDLAIRR